MQGKEGMIDQIDVRLHIKDMDVPSILQIDYGYCPTHIATQSRRERVSLPVASELCDIAMSDKRQGIV